MVLSARSSNQQRATNNQQPTTNNQQPTTNNLQLREAQTKNRMRIAILAHCLTQASGCEVPEEWRGQSLELLRRALAP